MESNRYATECLARTLSGKSAIFLLSRMSLYGSFLLLCLVRPSFSLMTFPLSQKTE